MRPCKCANTFLYPELCPHKSKTKEKNNIQIKAIQMLRMGIKVVESPKMKQR